jgi:hypothetical protein
MQLRFNYYILLGSVKIHAVNCASEVRDVTFYIYEAPGELRYKGLKHYNIFNLQKRHCE